MIAGLGNAIVDITSFADDDFVFDFSDEKNTMVLTTQEKQKLILARLDSPNVSCGGSIANTISSLAALGNETLFVGSVSKDEFGEKFVSDLDEMNVKYETIFGTESGSITGTSVVLITPDAKRTMFTNLGSSVNAISPSKGILNSVDIFLSECYLFDSENMTNVAFDIAKNQGLKTFLSLSDSHCVERNYTTILDYLKHVDVVVGNLEEVEVLLKDVDILDFGKKHNINLFVVTDGSNPVDLYGIKNEETVPVDAQEVEVVDTTGAGDQFLAGFVYGYSHNKSLIESVELGVKLASLVIQKQGARINLEIKHGKKI